MKVLYCAFCSPTEHAVNQLDSYVLLHPSYIRAATTSLNEGARKFAGGDWAHCVPISPDPKGDSYDEQVPLSPHLLHLPCLASRIEAALASLGAALGGKGGSPSSSSPPSKGAAGAPDAASFSPPSGKPDKPEERILVSAVAVEGGTPELRELAEGILALRPNFAYTLSEVQSEVDRVFSTGYFKAVTPLAEDTRDGIAFRLVLEENEPLQGVVVTGADPGARQGEKKR